MPARKLRPVPQAQLDAITNDGLKVVEAAMTIATTPTLMTTEERQLVVAILRGRSNRNPGHHQQVLDEIVDHLERLQ